MPATPFFELSLSAQDEQVDLIVELLWEMGTLGILEDKSDRSIQLKSYFSGSRIEETCRLFKTNCSQRSITYSELSCSGVADETEAWLTRSKEGFDGISVSKNLFVHPPWRTPSPDHPVNLLIEPGRAFGTGSHESTQLCMQALEDSLDGIENLLDVGTGSGILTITAAKLRAQLDLTAVDIDETSVGGARENFERNNVHAVKMWVGGPESVRGSFHVVVANLVLGVFRETAGDLARLTDRQLILSGFTVGQEPLVIELFRPHDLQITRRWVQKDWVCCRLERFGRPSGCPSGGGRSCTRHSLS